MATKHGVYVTEKATPLATPVTGTAGLQVVIGTAPVHLLDNPEAAVNVPLLAYSFAQAAQAVGYSDDFAAYSLCQSMSAAFQVVGTAPLVLINVLDPAKHAAEVEESTVQVNGGTAVLTTKGMLLKELVVKSGGTALQAGTDYTAAFNDEGEVVIALLGEGAHSTLTVSGKKLDAGKVTAQDIVGGVSVATGALTGIEVVQQVFPRLGLVPGILLAPGYSKDPAVAAALQAKCSELNGVFRCICVCDVNSGAGGALKYTDVKGVKEATGLTGANTYAAWLCAKVGDVVYSGSAIVAALMAYVDAANNDVPNMSVDNIPVSITAACLEDGTEVYLDQEQANVVVDAGVGTFLNFSGWRAWGSNTAAYPGNTDPKDRWINVRRFMNWAANSFILTHFGRVGKNINRALIDSIVDSENLRGNGFVSSGYCAGYSVEYDAEQNPVTNLIDGKVVFTTKCTPYPPANEIHEEIVYDPDALTAALS